MTEIIPLPEARGLAGLPLALDIGWVRNQIATRLSTGSSPIEIAPRYLRYKGLDGAVVGYRCTIPVEGRSATTYVTVRVVGEERLRAEMDRFRSSSLPGFLGLRSFAGLEKEGVALWALPLDRRLPELAMLLDVRKVRRLLKQLDVGIVHEGVRVSKSASHIDQIHYNPERRAVLRWRLNLVDDRRGDHEVRPVYFRCHADAPDPAAERTLRQARTGGLLAPRILGHIGDRVVVQEEIPGTPLAESDSLIRHLFEAGQWLGKLHDLPPDAPLACHHPRAHWEAAAQSCGDLALLRPEFAARAQQSLEVLRRWCASGVRTIVPLHGDFHLHQLVAAPEGLGVVDFDRAGPGPPALDLANFYAHLALEERPGWEEAYRALELGYGTVRSLPSQEELSWFQACSLLRIAAMPFRRLEREWPARIDRILHRVAARVGVPVP